MASTWRAPRCCCSKQQRGMYRVLCRVGQRIKQMRNFNLAGGLTLYLWVFLLLLAPNAFADSPTVQIKSAVDRVIKILTDPRFHEEAQKSERRGLLRQTILSRFDFKEMAKRSLGANWRRRTSEERGEFARIFSDLLEKAYVGQIESYDKEKFIFTGEKIDQSYAEVASKILTSKGDEFKINYKLHQVGNEWKVYDLVVEDISLVNYYRSQFNRIIAQSSYNELVSRIKQKLLETEGK